MKTKTKRNPHQVWCDLMVKKAQKSKLETWNGLYKTRLAKGE